MRPDVVKAALDCVGVRFRHQGRSKETGVDCMGLLYVVLQAVGYPKIIDVEGYCKSPSPQLIVDTLRQNFDEIQVQDVELGDIYLMKIGHGNEPKHASILVSNETDYEHGKFPQIVHAYALGSRGRVTIDPLEQWLPKCVKGFRLRH